jgi:hypothetical protein
VTARAFLDRYRGPRLAKDEIDRVAADKRRDRPPEDKWAGR